MNLDELAPLKFYQNLGRRQDRRGDVEYHFYERGIAVERFPAINAKYLKSECRYERKSARALAMTSRAALREAQRRGSEAVVIFEDDVVLAEDWRERLAEIELPEDWGILYLGCAHKNAPIPVGGGLVRVTGAIDTHAWVVRAKYWLAIRKHFQARTFPLPEAVHQDQLLMQLQQEIPTYAIWPNVAWQRESYSDNWGRTFSNYGEDGRQLAYQEATSGVNQAMAQLEYQTAQKLKTCADDDCSTACFWRDAQHFGVLANTLGLLGPGACLATRANPLEKWAGESLLTAAEIKTAPRLWEKQRRFDVIWLGGDMDYRKTTQMLEQAWPKLPQGGLLGGGAFANEFTGNPRDDFQWKVSQKALKHWASDKGLMPIYNKANRDWVMFKNKKPAPCEILVYSVCTSGVAYAAMTTENHRAFCQSKGYEYVACGDEVFPIGADGKLLRHPAWARFFALERLMGSRPDIRWFFYLDIDAIFHNWSYQLENFCLPAFDCICPTWEDTNGPRPSLASMLWQNTPTARKFMQAIWDTPLDRCTRSNEEDAIKHVLAEQPEFRRRLFGVPQRLMNAVPSHGNDWNGDDFILHFPSVGEKRGDLLKDVLASVPSILGSARLPQSEPPPQAVHVITHGRSGSTMLKALLNSLPGFQISGENMGVFHRLFLAWRDLAARDVKAGGAIDPFSRFGTFGATEFFHEVQSLFWQLLAPTETTLVVGFKEIRHTQAEIPDDAEFEEYLWFLNALIPGTRFIFLTRNPHDVAKSQWWDSMPKAVELIECTQRRFQAFNASNTDISWLLSYEDIIERGPNFTALFGWLGTAMPSEEQLQIVLQTRYACW